MADFKIALTAGHYLGTPGKRCLKSLDSNETREWTLNNRIADKVEKLLRNYTGYRLLRTDDTTGEKDVPLEARTTAANNFDADFYLSIHHNAGINGGSGGGIVAIVYNNASTTSVEWQEDLYNALIKATGLKGNRSTPLAKMNLHEVRETNMPAVLLELGFMDSSTDVPIILTENYATKCAQAITDVIVKRGKLKKKATNEENTATEVLKTGDKGLDVLCLKYLIQIAADMGIVSYSMTTGNNAFASGTEKTVRKLQKLLGLTQTGVADSELINKLYLKIKESYSVAGDFNGDGKVDISDATAIQKKLAEV